MGRYKGELMNGDLYMTTGEKPPRVDQKMDKDSDDEKKDTKST